jgi:protein kinase A
MSHRWKIAEKVSLYRHVGKYPEEQVRFYAAQIVLAFEYLHLLSEKISFQHRFPSLFHSISDIIYRNLKVEELLFGSDGYLVIAGFGLAKVVPEQTHTLCGTPQVTVPIFMLNLGIDQILT